MSDYIQLTAENNPGVRVFLDGEEVTRRGFWAKAPAKPGVKGPGSVLMFSEWPPRQDPKTGKPIEVLRAGEVYWLPAEGTL